MPFSSGPGMLGFCQAMVGTGMRLSFLKPQPGESTDSSQGKKSPLSRCLLDFRLEHHLTSQNFLPPSRRKRDSADVMKAANSGDAGRLSLMVQGSPHELFDFLGLREKQQPLSWL